MTDWYTPREASTSLRAIELPRNIGSAPPRTRQTKSSSCTSSRLCAFDCSRSLVSLLPSLVAARSRTCSLPNAACFQDDTTDTQHGHRLPARRLPAASPSASAAHSRHRHGPSWYALTGGLHEPTADTTGQSQQASPAAGRVRSTTCL